MPFSSALKKPRLLINTFSKVPCLVSGERSNVVCSSAAQEDQAFEVRFALIETSDSLFERLPTQSRQLEWLLCYLREETTLFPVVLCHNVDPGVFLIWLSYGFVGMYSSTRTSNGTVFLAENVESLDHRSLRSYLRCETAHAALRRPLGLARSGSGVDIGDSTYSDVHWRTCGAVWAFFLVGEVGVRQSLASLRRRANQYFQSETVGPGLNCVVLVKKYCCVSHVYCEAWVLRGTQFHPSKIPLLPESNEDALHMVPPPFDHYRAHAGVPGDCSSRTVDSWMYRLPSTFTIPANHIAGFSPAVTMDASVMRERCLQDDNETCIDYKEDKEYEDRIDALYEAAALFKLLPTAESRISTILDIVSDPETEFPVVICHDVNPREFQQWRRNKIGLKRQACFVQLNSLRTRTGTVYLPDSCHVDGSCLCSYLRCTKTHVMLDRSVDMARSEARAIAKEVGGPYPDLYWRHTDEGSIFFATFCGVHQSLVSLRRHANMLFHHPKWASSLSCVLLVKRYKEIQHVYCEAWLLRPLASKPRPYPIPPIPIVMGDVADTLVPVPFEMYQSHAGPSRSEELDGIYEWMHDVGPSFTIPADRLFPGSFPITIDATDLKCLCTWKQSAAKLHGTN